MNKLDQKLFIDDFTLWAWGKKIPKPLHPNLTKLRQFMERYFQENHVKYSDLIEKRKHLRIVRFTDGVEDWINTIHNKTVTTVLGKRLKFWQFRVISESMNKKEMRKEFISELSLHRHRVDVMDIVRKYKIVLPAVKSRLKV